MNEKQIRKLDDAELDAELRKIFDRWDKEDVVDLVMCSIDWEAKMDLVIQHHKD